MIFDEGYTDAIYILPQLDQDTCTVNGLMVYLSCSKYPILMTIIKPSITKMFHRKREVMGVRRFYQKE